MDAPSTPDCTLPLVADFAHALPQLGVAFTTETFTDPQLLLGNTALAEELGVDPALLTAGADPAPLVGYHLNDVATPVAQAYAGHQFGQFQPLLGDGRAVLLGELNTPHGLVDIHLKGAGRTVFSRGGDGYAALAPMLREYLISEFFRAVGIPTSGSLAVITTGQTVIRTRIEPGAVLVRTAPSHLRVGTVQLVRAHGDDTLLQALADYTIARHFPHCADDPQPYRALLAAVVDRQAQLIAQWMSIGFVHGVMNTDNMALAGHSFDFGPCAFLDGYDEEAVFSSIDHQGRYRYSNQPAAAQWNLARLAEALLPLLDPDPTTAAAIATEVIGSFAPSYRQAFAAQLQRKLGFTQPLPEDEALATDLLELMAIKRADFTATFRSLVTAAQGDDCAVTAQLGEDAVVTQWLQRWRAHHPDAAVCASTNPLYIPRNHLLDEALRAATDGDMAQFNALLERVSAPFDEVAGAQRYALPEEAARGHLTTYCGT